MFLLAMYTMCVIHDLGMSSIKHSIYTILEENFYSKNSK